VTVRRLAKSNTLTRPSLTRVSVPEHESCASQRVPETIAELRRPRGRLSNGVKVANNASSNAG